MAISQAKRLPRRWTDAELQSDASTARSAFRNERLLEPLDLYNQFFAVFAEIFRELINRLPHLAADPVDAQLLADLMDGRDAQKSFRYLTAPPISEDDLETVSDATLTPSRLRNDAASAKRIRDAVLSIIDPHRFPWMAEGRQPSNDERERAVIASAALAASSEVSTRRRNTSKQAQEQTVKDLLVSIGLREVKAREIPMLTAAPAPGHFCGETRLAGTRADVVARLKDGRVMAIECKVSNSTVNSYKRLVHDTGGKAAHWYNQLGRAQVIPCAILSGVYNTANLADVQGRLLVLAAPLGRPGCVHQKDEISQGYLAALLRLDALASPRPGCRGYHGVCRNGHGSTARGDAVIARGRRRTDNEADGRNSR